VTSSQFSTEHGRVGESPAIRTFRLQQPHPSALSAPSVVNNPATACLFTRARSACRVRCRLGRPWPSQPAEKLNSLKGHGFSRAATGANETRLEPLRPPSACRASGRRRKPRGTAATTMTGLQARKAAQPSVHPHRAPRIDAWPQPGIQAARLSSPPTKPCSTPRRRNISGDGRSKVNVPIFRRCGRKGAIRSPQHGNEAL